MKKRYIKIIFNNKITLKTLLSKNNQKIFKEVFDYFDELKKTYQLLEKEYTVFFQKNNILSIHITTGNK